MAKILIIRLQFPIVSDVNAKICYYDSLDRELTQEGNDLLWLNSFPCTYATRKERKEWISTWVDKVKNFNPDIIFTFNNQIFEDIIRCTDCPIVLWEADLLEYFVNIDFIKKYRDRYYVVTFFSGYISRYRELGFDENKIVLLHPASSVIAENKEKINNISFIGSNFCFDYSIKDRINNEINKIYPMLREFWNTENYDYESLCHKYLKNTSISIYDCYSLFDSRMYILQSLLDLGVTLYGVGWGKGNSLQALQLNACANNTPLYSLQHNQDLYNSSKINLSISHPQCKGYAFPWRIYDIMASKGVLVSSYSNYLDTLTKGYVKIPMYKSPYEARDLCKKLLDDENLRKETIDASNEFIEKFGRWGDNFKTIEDCTGVIIKSVKENGSSTNIEYELSIKKESRGVNKSVYYALLYFLSKVFFLRALFGERFVTRIYKSMIKQDKLLRRMFNDRC